MSVETLENEDEVKEGGESGGNESSAEALKKNVPEEDERASNDLAEVNGEEDYWHQVAKDEEEGLEKYNYWTQVSRDAEESEKTIPVLEITAVSTEDSIEEENEEEEEDDKGEPEAEPEPTPEEKAAAALILSYWQTITHAESDERDRIEAAVQSMVQSAVITANDSAENEEEELQASLDEVHREDGEESSATKTLPETPIPAARRSEKDDTNVEVLTRIAAENEEEMSTVFKMLAWAKNTRRAKTDTFVVRAKKKEESIRRAVDFGSMDIVIEDKSKESSKMTTKVTASQPVRVTDELQVHSNPDSGTTVTREWIVNAIQIYEQENEVEIVNLRFDGKAGGGASTEVFVKALVGPAVAKEYHWVIKEAPKVSLHYDPKDKETYVLSDLGSKLAKFVASKKLKKSFSIPFQPVIMADHEFAVFDDIGNFKVFTDESGFDLDHMKQALKALAILHAMSFAYFSDAKKDAKAFSDSVKVLVDHPFHVSASQEEKHAAKADLDAVFENLLRVVGNVDKEGAQIAQKAKAKFGDRLYDLCRDASASSSNFSVLCHGCPTPENVRFLHSSDSHRPVEVKFTGFQLARYAHAVTDLQLLMCTAMSPKVAEQSEFLLRFVYYETLASTVKTLGAATPVIDYDVLMKDYKSKQVFGCLVGAMHLAGTNVKPIMTARRATGKRVFESKLAGKINTSTDAKALETQSVPALRAKELLAKALTG